MGGLDHGLSSKYCSSSATLAAFQSFLNNSTGLRHLSCTIIIPNNFPFASAFSTASQPPSAHRASVYAIGSSSLSTLYSDFRRDWLCGNNNEFRNQKILTRNINTNLHHLELQLTHSSENERPTSIIVALTKCLHGTLCQQLIDTLLK